MCVCHSVVSNCSWPHGLQPASLLGPRDAPGENMGVGCYAHLQGIFPTRGSNPGLPQCRRILYHLNHQGCPWILKWVAYPFFRGIFPTQESNCTADGFFTSWVTRETQGLLWVSLIIERCHTLDLQNWRRKVGVTFTHIMSLKWRTANRFEYQLCHTTELALGSILQYS